MVHILYQTWSCKYTFYIVFISGYLTNRFLDFDKNYENIEDFTGRKLVCR